MNVEQVSAPKRRQPPPKVVVKPASPWEKYEPDTDVQRALGAIGAGTGALLGRLAVPTRTTILGSKIGGNMGPWGGIIGGTVGLAVGLFTEFRNARYAGFLPVGRFAGGMVGGFLGASIGTVLDKMNLDPTNERLRHETAGFSLEKLVGRLADVSYTSHKTFTTERIAEFKNKLEPGDIIVTNHDKYLDIEVPEVILGIGGAWTHTAIYVGNGECVEALMKTGVIQRPVEEVLGENHHARILRPAYRTDQDAQAAADEARKHVGAGYDAKFDLASDEGFGCVELAYKAVHRAAPYIDIKPHSLFGKEYLSHKVFNRSPDMTVVEDTGSSFFYNYLSKFT